MDKTKIEEIKKFYSMNKQSLSTPVIPKQQAPKAFFSKIMIKLEEKK